MSNEALVIRHEMKDILARVNSEKLPLELELDAGVFNRKATAVSQDTILLQPTKKGYIHEGLEPACGAGSACSVLDVFLK